MVYAAIMGYGTIGSGVFEVLTVNRAQVAAAAGQEIEVKYVLDLRDFPGSPAEDKIVHDFSVIVNDPEVKLVVETMGGLQPAYPFVKACLEAGKHVATSNKALVAAYGTELLAIARKKHVNFQFEGSAGGGIPIIRTLYRCLGGERISEITGILNGTTNYILTKMDREGMSFEQALKQAQELGYAEKDPTADVEGHDTCRKIAILTAMASGKEVDYEDIYTEGITKIHASDLKYAAAMEMAVRLLGSAQMAGDAVSAWVAPVMVGRENPLSGVNDVFNGILVRSNMLGVSMYYGSGAGKLQTASAVVADLIEETVHLNENVPMGWSGEKLSIMPVSDVRWAYFLRIGGAYDAVKDLLAGYLGECRVVTLPELGGEEFGLLTGVMSEGFMDAALEALVPALEAAGSGLRQKIRVETLNEAEILP